MDPLYARAALFGLVDLIALSLLSWLAPRPMPEALLLASAVGTIASYPAATIVVLSLLEPRAKERNGRWLIRALGIPLGAAVALGASWFAFDPTEFFRLRPGFLLWLLGCATCAGLMFKVVADLVRVALERLPKLRDRFTMLGIFASALTLLLEGLARQLGFDSPFGSLLVGFAVVLVVWGFASTSSLALTRRLEVLVSGLTRLGAGDLDVQLELAGRDELSAMAQTFNGAVAMLREKAFLERAFGRYASLDVLRALKHGGNLQLAPERREATVLFADIRGFTAMSETASPEVVLGILNTYFARVVEVVGAHGGYINKFIGDAIMVVFNAPSLQEDHAGRAVDCARGIQDAVEALNAARAFGERSLQVGVGVNTGPLVAGSLGGEARAEYTVIGDTVNVASRLTSAARPGQVLVGARTQSAADRSGLTALSPIQVKGKSEPLPVFQAR